MSKSIQIVIEDTNRCGGNCSGCSLMSTERMQKSGFDFLGFNQKVEKVNDLLVVMAQESADTKEEIESISIFLGQGDHFLMSNDEIQRFVESCSKIIPESLKSKSVIFVTASAIGNSEEIMEKMNLFYDLFLEYKVPFFIQAVFDPKKYVQYKNFQGKYLRNILVFKEKCLMTELTINLGEDVFENMTPKNFHDFMCENGFLHAEFNWIMSNLTIEMWKNKSHEMWSWLKELIVLNKEDHRYEINFLPIMGNALRNKGKDVLRIKDDIAQSLENNIYIGYGGDINLGQMGVINNITTLEERKVYVDSKIINFEKFKNSSSLLNKKIQDFKTGKELYSFVLDLADKYSKTVQLGIMKRSSCQDCDYKSVCSVGGSYHWFKYFEGNKDVCPWEIKSLYEHVESIYSVDELRTVFDKNPVQSSFLQGSENDTGKEVRAKLNLGAENV